MKRSLIATTVLTIALSLPVQVSAKTGTDTSVGTDGTPVLIGAGSGALLGAAIAGPVGFAVGGLMGIFIGNDHHQHQVLAQTEAALKDEKRALWAANQSIAEYQTALNEANLALRQAKLSELTTQIQFKTGESAISPIFHEYLDKLVQLMEQDWTLSLAILGHADSRGDETYNLALSRQRAQNIMNYLVDSGIDAQRLSVEALGETTSRGANNEEHFFDRKVVMRLSTTSQDKVTAKR
jgi:sortase system peptidoglycan-associated protein